MRENEISSTGTVTASIQESIRENDAEELRPESIEEIVGAPNKGRTKSKAIAVGPRDTTGVAVVTDTMETWMAPERCRYSPRQYLGYTAVRYPELSGNVARSDAAVRQLDDPLPDYIR